MRSFQNRSRLVVLVVGLGAVGTALAYALKRNPEVELALFGRKRNRDRKLAHELEVPLFIHFESVKDLPNAIILAVRDDQIQETAQILAKSGLSGRHSAILHTSGSLGINPLKPLADLGAAVAAFHPYQTFPKARKEVKLNGVTFGIDGDARGIRIAGRMARLLGGVPVRVSGEHRVLYHASAVLACGMVAANLEMAITLLQHCGFSERQARAATASIAGETLHNALEFGIKQALTGPAVRGDFATIRKHLAALAKINPGIAQTYRTASSYLTTTHPSIVKRKSR